MVGHLSDLPPAFLLCGTLSALWTVVFTFYVRWPGVHVEALDAGLSLAIFLGLPPFKGGWLGNSLLSLSPPTHVRPSSNVNFLVAWITGPATDPSLGCLGYG
jgi:hypothetical protein